MGVSTDGILLYGYIWDEPVPDPEDDDYEPDDFDEDDEADERGFATDLDDWADSVLRAQGHHNPLDDCPEGGYHAFAEANRAALDTWRAMKRELKDATGVDWGHHCSDEYSIPYLYIKGTETTAGRGTPMALAPDALAVDEGWRQQLDAFLASQNIDPPEGENHPAGGSPRIGAEPQ